MISPTRTTWHHMMRRCYNPADRGYRHYGGRGITVCARWHVFENFQADMGVKPDGLTLDRIDNDDNTSLKFRARAVRRVSL